MVTAAGQSAIKEVKITNHAGAYLDITDLVMEINIYEDFFGNVMSGNLVILDASGLLSNLPVIGQEKIEFQVSSEIWGTKNYEFYSYLETNRFTENYVTASYVLNFISKEAIDDKLVKFSKSYRGTIGQMVQKIFKDWISTSKLLSVENTSNNTSFISPYWSPLECINHLSARATPTNGGLAGFFFYENQDGFNFKSIQNLFKQESIGELKYRDANVASSTGAKSKISYHGLTIEDYEILSNLNTLDMMSSGMLGSTLYVKDLTKNQWSKYSWNYIKEFNKSAHMNKNPIFPSSNAYGHDFKYVYPETRLSYTHDNCFTNIKDPFFPKEWVSSRMSALAQLNAIRLNVSVPGHILFSVGKTIDLVFPTNTPFTKGNSSVDPYLSGKYLITAVRHNFQLKFHRVSFEVVKESTEGIIL